MKKRFVYRSDLESLLDWATSDDTGLSSKALLRHMMGFSQKYPMPPSDADDRGRCMRLLKICPEWIRLLEDLRPYWGEQVDLIKKEFTL